MGVGPSENEWTHEGPYESKFFRRPYDVVVGVGEHTPPLGVEDGHVGLVSQEHRKSCTVTPTTKRVDATRDGILVETVNRPELINIYNNSIDFLHY